MDCFAFGKLKQTFRWLQSLDRTWYQMHEIILTELCGS